MHHRDLLTHPPVARDLGGGGQPSPIVNRDRGSDRPLRSLDADGRRRSGETDFCCCILTSITCTCLLGVETEAPSIALHHNQQRLYATLADYTTTKATTCLLNMVVIVNNSTMPSVGSQQETFENSHRRERAVIAAQACQTCRSRYASTLQPTPNARLP